LHYVAVDVAVACPLVVIPEGDLRLSLHLFLLLRLPLLLPVLLVVIPAGDLRLSLQMFLPLLLPVLS